MLNVRHFHEERLTIAVKTKSKKTIIGVAKACPKDSWSRSLGHQIAINRLKAKKKNIAGKFELDGTFNFKKSPHKIDWSKLLKAVEAKYYDRLTLGRKVSKGVYLRDNLGAALVELAPEVVLKTL